MKVTQQGIISTITLNFFLYEPVQFYLTSTVPTVQNLTPSSSSSPPSSLSTFTTINNGSIKFVVTGGYVGMTIKSVASGSQAITTVQPVVWLQNDVGSDDLVITLQTVNAVTDVPQNADGSTILVDGYKILPGNAWDVLTYTVHSSTLESVSYVKEKTAYIVAVIKSWQQANSGSTSFSTAEATHVMDVIVLQNAKALLTPPTPLHIYIPNTQTVDPLLPLFELVNGGDLGAYSIVVNDRTLDTVDGVAQLLHTDGLSGTLNVTVGQGATSETIDIPYTITTYTIPAITTSYDTVVVLFPKYVAGTFEDTSANIGYVDTDHFNLAGISIVTDESLGDVAYTLYKNGDNYTGKAVSISSNKNSSSQTPVLQGVPPSVYLGDTFTLGIEAFAKLSDIPDGTYCCTLADPVIAAVPSTGDAKGVIATTGADNNNQDLYFEESNIAVMANEGNRVHNTSVVVNRNVHDGEHDWVPKGGNAISDSTYNPDTTLLAPNDSSSVIYAIEPIIANTVTYCRVYDAFINSDGVYAIASPVTQSANLTFIRKDGTTSTSLTLSHTDSADVEWNEGFNGNYVAALTCKVTTGGNKYVLVIERSHGDIYNLTKLDRSAIAYGNTAADFVYETFFPIRVYDFDPVVSILRNSLTVPRKLLTRRPDLSTQFPDCCHLLLDAVYSCPDGQDLSTASSVVDNTLLYSIQVSSADHPLVWYEIESNLQNEVAVGVSSAPEGSE
ncbi:MAG: hypothetical protein WCO49_19510, partial [Nostocales cyanobacterium ELA608]